MILYIELTCVAGDFADLVASDTSTGETKTTPSINLPHVLLNTRR